MPWRASAPNTRGFNPRTPCGVRPEKRPPRTVGTGFNPRTPCGVRHGPDTAVCVFFMFQSTHSLRSATRTGRGPNQETSGFNPRTPCGVRPATKNNVDRRTEFQSTHSLRSATGIRPESTRYRRSFNPRTPCGVRLRPPALPSTAFPVSIHALLAECDKKDFFLLQFLKKFQSTHSLRSATVPERSVYHDNQKFQSTHSLRSATLFLVPNYQTHHVSIHALLAECDKNSTC